MLYIGHFSFDEMGREQKIRHGYLTCIVKSNSAERAVEEFKFLIEDKKTNDELFAAIRQVYIEDIFEIREVPHTAMILRLQSSAGEFPESVSRTLPFSDSAIITAYGWEKDVRKIRKAQKDEVLEMAPFLSFES
jgi:hypothetical protein